jgi:hypothetical protein
VGGLISLFKEKFSFYPYNCSFTPTNQYFFPILPFYHLTLHPTKFFQYINIFGKVELSFPVTKFSNRNTWKWLSEILKNKTHGLQTRTLWNVFRNSLKMFSENELQLWRNSSAEICHDFFIFDIFMIGVDKCSL